MRRAARLLAALAIALAATACTPLTLPATPSPAGLPNLPTPTIEVPPLR